MKTEKRSKPSYKQVEDTIRNKILSGELGPGDKIPTERELEKEFNLSRITISKGLSNLVSEGLLMRKQGHGTFVTLGSKKEDTPRLIKYISPMGFKGEVPIRYGVLEAMHDVLADKGYETGIDFYGTIEEQSKCIRCDRDAYHAGFIIFFEPGCANVEELSHLKEENFPFVLIDAYPPDMDMDFVVTDNIEGGRMVVEHLVQLGHRNITYVTKAIDRSSMSDRLSGFIKGLVIQDLPFSQNSVYKLKSAGAESVSEIPAAMDDILSYPEAPTAIFFSNDTLALEALSYLTSRGIRVPEDISIVGYDNIDRSTNAPVPLATVAQDFYELAKKATEVLIQKIEGKECSGNPVQLFVKPRFIQRSSTRKIS